VSRTVIPNPVQVNGLQLYWHSANYSTAIEYSLGKYEKDTTLLFKRILHPGMVALDLGANMGYFSLLFAKYVGKEGKVYAFEPHPTNCTVLSKSIKANGFDNIMVVQKAVSNKLGLASLHFNESGSGGSSVYKRNLPNVDEQNRHIEVETISLDTFFEHEGWPAVDIIKMDIEGAENVALVGAKQLIQRSPKLKMVMEFNPNVQTDAGVSPEGLFTTLLSVGFQTFSLIQDYLQPINVPDDISHLVKVVGEGYANLLCEK
jgi:FkbM family methyltransferase